MNNRRPTAGEGTFKLVVPVTLFGLAPIAALLTKAMSPATEGRAFIDTSSLPLLGRTVALALGAAGIALVLGVAFGSLLARGVERRTRHALMIPLLVALCVSPYIVGLGWLGGQLTTGWSAAMLGSAWAVAVVLGAAQAPLAALLVLGAMAARPGGPEEAGLIAVGPIATIRSVVLPGMRGAVAFAGVFVFARCLSDYAVPSLFQVPTYPVEVFLYASGMHDPVAAARACVPLICVTAVVSLMAAFGFESVLSTRGNRSSAEAWPAKPWTRRTSAVLVALFVVMTHGAPLAGVLFRMSTLAAYGRTLVSGWESIGHSLALAAIGAVATLILGWVGAVGLAHASKPMRICMAALWILPFALPATAFGIAWITLAGSLGEVGRFLAVLGPPVALAARCGGIAALLLYAVRRNLPAESTEAARLVEGRSWMREWRVTLPSMKHTAILVGALFFALHLNAVGVLVLTAPPGYELLPLRIDNLLHYGVPEEAALLAVVAAMIAAVPAAATVVMSIVLRRHDS